MRSWCAESTFIECMHGCARGCVYAFLLFVISARMYSGLLVHVSEFGFLFLRYLQICLSVVKLTAGDRPDTALNLKGVLSVVSQDLKPEGARARLIAKVEPGSELARPKLLGFQDPLNPDSIEWALYLNQSILFDDRFHLTGSIAVALVHLELVRERIPNMTQCTYNGATSGFADYVCMRTLILVATARSVVTTSVGLRLSILYRASQVCVPRDQVQQRYTRRPSERLLL